MVCLVVFPATFVGPGDEARQREGGGVGTWTRPSHRKFLLRKVKDEGSAANPDVAPRLIDGRVMVPVRWVAEALGADVQWDAESRQVTVLRSPDAIPTSWTGKS